MCLLHGADLPIPQDLVNFIDDLLIGAYREDHKEQFSGVLSDIEDNRPVMRWNDEICLNCYAYGVELCNTNSIHDDDELWIATFGEFIDNIAKHGGTVRLFGEDRRDNGLWR
jgi:hypothetical protein